MLPQSARALAKSCASTPLLGLKQASLSSSHSSKSMLGAVSVAAAASFTTTTTASRPQFWSSTAAATAPMSLLMHRACSCAFTAPVSTPAMHAVAAGTRRLASSTAPPPPPPSSPTSQAAEQAAAHGATSESKPTPVGSIDPSQGRFLIAFTCKPCSHRNSKTISKHSYQKGVVLIRCDGCKQIHLIADNLNWFQTGHRNIEEILRAKGQTVIRNPETILRDHGLDLAALSSSTVEINGSADSK
ncbi:hypothetical protein CAOG_05239 [Capsaspora owczarzaki ATCC 30864]|uniref:DNL-type domain-containing protein n=1 Tax=Capsaspora owczarzaki (strain ATCC 30864) TaxID=595528 RepID=A0A0D2X3N5_CAPO3|nr:hypothetical protein CAOG_05239 [Capsaspora owczarzaki ATCC 30864]KJE94619.1 hypothetical protein CAOG_005239 [Capsaspora owczarzaki ATCC 30864]|eukprot:XP_004346924.1 hypothetical protein CAOG_05239 [Capsaspora owczarzaki ATCC 30864]